MNKDISRVSKSHLGKIIKDLNGRDYLQPEDSVSKDGIIPNMYKDLRKQRVNIQRIE